MIIAIDGTLYVVSWKHDQPGRATTCRIKILCTGRIPRDVVVSTRVHPKDHYVKETGRKWSLLAAVGCLDLDKPVRTAILKTYFDRKLNPPAPRLIKEPPCTNCESNPADNACVACGARVCPGCRDADGRCPFCSQR